MGPYVYIRRASLSILALTVLSMLPASGQALNQLTPDETAAGWKLLFNGTTNAGWLYPGGSPAQWTLEDNALKNSGGDICTEGEYQDFEFVTDYKYGTGGNSGIFIRTRKGVNPPYKSGIEIGIQDNGRAGNLYKNGDASVYDVKPPSVDKWTGPEKWNTQRIRVAGSRLEVHHNGEKVIDMDMASQEWKDSVAKSKFSDGTWPLWGKDGKGQICLQDHGIRILFRNIKVLALTPGPVKPGKARGTGFNWNIRGAGADRRLAVEIPGGAGLAVSVLDARGKEWTSGSSAGSKADLSLRGLPRGLYWLRVVSDGFAAERRFTSL